MSRPRLSKAKKLRINLIPGHILLLSLYPGSSSTKNLMDRHVTRLQDNIAQILEQLSALNRPSVATKPSARVDRENSFMGDSRSAERRNVSFQEDEPWSGANQRAIEACNMDRMSPSRPTTSRSPTSWRCVLDVIGEIHPHSSRGDAFILVATDYFTKWVKAQVYKKIDHNEVISFLRTCIIYRFGIPQNIVVDNGTVFNNARVREFAEEFGFSILNSTPYYPQVNGQAEASNKLIKNNIHKMVGLNPKKWHEVLNDTLWALRVTKRESTEETPFALVYGHDAVLPIEMRYKSLRVSQPCLQDEAMHIALEELERKRLEVVDKIEVHKQRIARYYNKKVVHKNFQIGDLVWKMILPLKSKDQILGKWSPNWEGPYQVSETFSANSYRLSTLEGVKQLLKINGKYLKHYRQTIWESHKKILSKRFPFILKQIAKN
ncbi:hypothetical protein MLD38_006550 [Melastoma candidum]|uniref:Uncharacterized protein n=1 Tax=Melastoma candidum TaxID=119954 RepID=A0ACB9RQ51_9MYRT|nr:hypothetical protein MLD38_006550 [Melastoma candidum]